MKLNAKPDINVEIFLYYMRTVFLFGFVELHALDAFLQQIAVLLMDNCSNHIISDLIRLLTEA
jgi:hypothetical protein